MDQGVTENKNKNYSRGLLQLLTDFTEGEGKCARI
jgi:hypothetical protein